MIAVERAVGGLQDPVQMLLDQAGVGEGKVVELGFLELTHCVLGLQEPLATRRAVGAEESEISPAADPALPVCQ
eukprot:4722345-Pyramimonas_sp.AAC.1